jgi:hypothetical protein
LEPAAQICEYADRKILEKMPDIVPAVQRSTTGKKEIRHKLLSAKNDFPNPDKHSSAHRPDLSQGGTGGDVLLGTI